VKNYLIGGLLCLVAALIIGIEPLQRALKETTKGGTLRGAEACIAYSSGGLLSEDAVKATCVATFQRNVFNGDLATGRAGPRLNDRTVDWYGILENKTPDHVTTRVRVTVSIYDTDGTEEEFFAETSIWIDPLNKADFTAELLEVEPEQLVDIEFCDHENLEPTACMTWGITDIMGLSI
jgi:hypothetical protein